MKLQKQLSRRVGNKEYPKWVITIPPRQIESLRWNEGEYIESEVNNRKLIIRREDPKKVQKRSGTAKKAWKTRKAKEKKRK
jgi:antitoxin component of MazEF toxin-antitoxin module